MNNSDSTAVVARFFVAIDRLIQLKRLRGLATFARLYGVDRRNLLKLKKDNTRGIFQPSWLSYLVTDFGVSPRWLLTGMGDWIEG